MPGVTEMGMVWMGAGQAAPDISMGLMHTESGDMILDHDSPYFTPSHHSTSNQSLEDMQNVHNVSDFSMCVHVCRQKSGGTCF